MEFTEEGSHLPVLCAVLFWSRIQQRSWVETAPEWATDGHPDFAQGTLWVQKLMSKKELQKGVFCCSPSNSFSWDYAKISHSQNPETKQNEKMGVNFFTWLNNLLLPPPFPECKLQCCKKVALLIRCILRHPGGKSTTSCSVGNSSITQGYGICFDVREKAIKIWWRQSNFCGRALKQGLPKM